MKRLPILPTIIVGISVAMMIGLGFWQLQRREWKEAVIARYAQNIDKPPVAYPRFADQSLLFRKSGAFCLKPVAFHLVGAGSAGYRMLADCKTGAEGPGMTVQLGTTRNPQATVAWTGGEVSGFISHAPDGRSLIGSLFDKTPQPLLLVTDTPAAGLNPNPGPDLSGIPNNHLAYAVQWFLFAGIAVVIYLLALRRRQHGSSASDGKHDAPE